MPRLERIEQQPAYLLHHYPYRETSRLLEIFTPDHGRVGLVAKGLRSSPHLRAVIQPFQPLIISWSSRGDLGTLHTAEIDAATGGYNRLTGRPLLSGYYLNELILRLTARHDALPALYRDYRETLRTLEQNQNITLRYFEKRLLTHLGYGMQLTHESNTGKAVEAGELYRFEPQQGLIHVQQQGRHIYTGKQLLALAHEALDSPDQQKAAQSLLGFALQYYLGDKVLRTREILRGLYRQELNNSRVDSENEN